MDRLIRKLIKLEKKRQKVNLELIASENYASKEIRKITGSILTNKYAEGYVGKRYYGGCKYIDEIEEVAKERLKKLYKVKYVNVQPHSGTQANMASYYALLEKNDTIMALELNDGGHLSHGHNLSFSGSDYHFIFYHLNDDGFLDYSEIEELAKINKPKLIVAGASAYPREIDFKKLKDIANMVDAYLMVDMAHIAGLVAAGLHSSPIPYADIVTSTTHKTLRGPRGGIILTNDYKIAKKIDKAVFPRVQGGPLMHVIAAKAVCFKEALEESFVEYQKQVIKNAKTLASELIKKGYNLVSNGTDNHLMIVNVKKSLGITGKLAEEVLDRVGITCNKNTVFKDSEPPFISSGIRLGTPALTTRGMKEKEMVKIATFIDITLRNYENDEILKKVKREVGKLTKKFKIK